ncbi:MAG: class I SAM-dependent methyltransferase [Candidatus Hodarchaeales archaeon]|jgi:ubiquinone/menaquinone biosynthesis C-methylase UbiE
MRPHSEPKGIELQTMYKYLDFKDKNVLEVGCGNGRLTYQFADITRKVVAIDPDVENIKRAKKDLPESLGSKLEFHIQSAENLSFINDTFDIALFSYSLCCMDSLQTMQASLDEVQQRLKPGGFIIVLLDSLQMPFKRGTIKYLITKKRSHLVSVWDEEHVAKAQEAIFLIRQSALIEKRLDFIAEEEFSFSTVCDTNEEAIKYWLEERYEDYLKLDEKLKYEIESILESITTSQGILVPENTVLTVLRKSNN